MERVLFQDVVPYDAPSSLESLRGPERGTLVLPKSVYWGPAREFDLAEPADLVSAYQAILQEGSGSQQEALLNAALLRRVWSWLTLPRRCQQLWESRFPDLASLEGEVNAQ